MVDRLRAQEISATKLDQSARTPLSAATLSSEILYEGWGTLARFAFRYRRPDGESDQMSREIYDRGQSGAVLLYNDKRGTVVLVKQFRPTPMVNGENPYLLEACAGLLDDDEPEECVRREAVEEAGISVADLSLVSAAYSNPAALTEVVSMFIGTFEDDRRTSGGGLAHEDEHIEVVELPFDEAYELIAAGGIVDMKTIVLLQHLKIKRMQSY